MQKEILDIQTQEASNKSQELNSTQILYDYISMQSSTDGENATTTLTPFIEKEQSPEVKEVLEAIEINHSFWQSKDILTQQNTAESIKNKIKETLESYKKYFLIKFPRDKDIQEICENFTENGALFQSLKNEPDKNSLKKVGEELDAYLIKLTIMAESKTNNGNDANNPDDDKSKKDDLDKIKNFLLIFPGKSSDVPYACIAGTRQRIQEVIFTLTSSSPELKSAKNAIDTLVSPLISKVNIGNHIHIPPCLLGSLVLDGRDIAKIDNFYTSPTSEIELKEIISFGYHFTKKIKKELSLMIQEVGQEYSKLTEEGAIGAKTIDFDAINNFVGKAKLSGFTIATHSLIKENYDGNYLEIKASELITQQELEQLLFKITRDDLSSKAKGKLKIDYLSHLPDPADLFKIDTSEPAHPIRNKLDFKKIENLVALFPSTEEESDETTRKSKVCAGLITLRNILNAYKKSDDGYLYYLKFFKKFKEKNGVFFTDFLCEQRDGKTIMKDEFKELKTLLETIKAKASNEEELFKKNYGANAQLLQESDQNPQLLTEHLAKIDHPQLLAELISITSSQDSLTLISQQPNILKIKNNSKENLLHILYQIDEVETFKIIATKAPELIVENNNEGLSPIKILAQEGNSELLLHVLQEYKKKMGDEALIKMIHEKELLFDIVKANELDLLRKLIGMANAKTAIDFNRTNFFGLTILSLASQKGHFEIAKELLENNANPDIANHSGNTALIFASQYGHIEVVKILLEKNANPNIKNKNRNTAIELASQNNHLTVVEALFDAGASSNSLKIKSFFSACRGSSFKATQEMKKLIKKINNPKIIKHRDQDLERAEISKRQVAFNQANIEETQDLSPESSEYSQDFRRECINVLLFLKFVASEFSPQQKKSTLTQDQRISEMLKIYLSENKLVESVPPILESVVKNENGLKDLLQEKSVGELIDFFEKFAKKEDLKDKKLEKIFTKVEEELKKITPTTSSQNSTKSKAEDEIAPIRADSPPIDAVDIFASSSGNSVASSVVSEATTIERESPKEEEINPNIFVPQKEELEELCKQPLNEEKSEPPFLNANEKESKPPFLNPPSNSNSKNHSKITQNLAIGGALIGGGAVLCASALTAGLVFSAPVIATVAIGVIAGLATGLVVGTIIEKASAKNIVATNKHQPSTP